MLHIVCGCFRPNVYVLCVISVHSLSHSSNVIEHYDGNVTRKIKIKKKRAKIVSHSTTTDNVVDDNIRRCWLIGRTSLFGYVEINIKIVLFNLNRSQCTRWLHQVRIWWWCDFCRKHSSMKNTQMFQ